MKNILRLTMFLTCLLVAGTSMAQDAAKDTEKKPSGEEAFPVSKEPADGPFVKATYGKWRVICVQSDDVENCAMSIRLTDANGNPTADMSIEALPNGKEAVAGATLVTPLATLLPPGIAYSIDSDRARRYQFDWCDRGGCISRFGFTEEEVGFMEEGKLGKLTIVAVADQANPLSLDVPLDGFKDAWADISKASE